MSKKNEMSVSEAAVTTEQNVEVEATVTTEQNVEVEKTVFEQLDTLKAEEAEARAQLAEVSKIWKEKIADLKVAQEKLEAEHAEEIAAYRAEKIKEALLKATEKGENKTERIRKLVLEGKTKEQIKAETGYDNKTVLDIVWRIERSLGLR